MTFNWYNGLTPKGSLATCIIFCIVSYNINANTPSIICNVCSIPYFKYKCIIISQSESVEEKMFKYSNNCL